MSIESRPMLCLSASGGGHVRQILDLEPLWRNYPHFIVTEDTSLGRSIAKQAPTEFVPHFAIGQAKLGAPLVMIAQAWRSLWHSLGIVRRHRPDVVLTTGAGSQLFVVVWARLCGAKIILIDSFARFDRPSAFARLAGWLAHVRIAQSAVSGAKWPGARIFDPLRMLDGPSPPKEALMFATVGATLPFERLTHLVIDAKRAGLIPERVVLQTGVGGPTLDPVEGVEIVEELPFDEVQRLLVRADIVVCHGGTGSLITALRQHCRVIAVPRRHSAGEHYDDHQFEITSAFEQRGLVTIAEDAAGFAAALVKVRSEIPRAATTDPQALIGFLRDYLERLSPPCVAVVAQ